MKKLILFILTVFALQANAAILTVNNAPNGGAQFTKINDAIAAANNGDIIYIHGSPDVYEGIIQNNKKLTFIGPGWSPNKNNPVRALIASIIARNTNQATAVNTVNGSEYIGLVINGEFRISQNGGGDVSVNNIRIDRCEFRQDLLIQNAASNYIIENCYKTGQIARILLTESLSYSNFLIQNNIFRIDAFSNGFFNGFKNISNVIINHNLFYTNAPGTTGSLMFTSECKGLLLTNNIFVNMNVGANLSFSTFNNNLTFYPNIAVLPGPWTINNNIDGGSSNLQNVNPGMVAQTAVNAGTDNPILDFSIAAGAANNAGTDGKDLGLLFDATGNLNWNNARGARIPFIFSMNIINPTVAPGANLNVEVTAKKQN